jgi:mRNA-degrading endonuclease RelE of RelBE toxin-antitoxin system
MTTKPKPIYRIEFTPEVRDFIRRLVKQDRAAVFHELRLVATRLVDPKIVESIPSPKTYYVYVHRLSRQWPQGLRIFFTVRRSVMTITVVNVGDHHTSATHPSHSIYPDER